MTTDKLKEIVCEELQSDSCIAHCNNYCHQVNGIVNKINSTPPQEPTINAVVLPCKVGDNLYRQDGIWDCVGFDCDQNGTWRVKLRKNVSNHYLQTRMVFGSFGKTVFISREEYEKVLPSQKPTVTNEQQEKLDYLKRQHEQHEDWLKRDWNGNKPIDSKYIIKHETDSL